ncbi:MAG TPA: hypothetical protein VM510_03390 [Caulifigura sp.]|nr:hypothetical protein [Caulifigura sp.]
MGQLADRIRGPIREGRYVVSEHASERITERGFLEWQIVDGSIDGEVLIERSENRPHPAVEFECLLPDGTAFKAVWCLLPQSQVAKLVTVHYLNE